MIEDDVSSMEGELLNILDKKNNKDSHSGSAGRNMRGAVSDVRNYGAVACLQLHRRRQELDKDGEYLYAETLISDGWVKEMPEGFAYPSQFDPASFSCYNERGINTSYGRIVEFRVTNLSDIEIHDWELVIPISADMYTMMPNMNGYEATKAIRNQQNRPDGCMIPIIAMTANAFAEDVQTSLEAGMNGHLSKPIVIDEVVKTITRNLDR